VSQRLVAARHHFLAARVRGRTLARWR